MLYRYLGYIELHMSHLPGHVQTKLDLIKCSDYPGYTPDLLTLSSSIACSSSAAASTTSTSGNAVCDLVGDDSHPDLADGGSASVETSLLDQESHSSESQSLTNQESRLLRSIYPHSIVLNPTSNVTKKLKSHWRREDYDFSFHGVLDNFKAEEACRRIQIWVKSIFVARKALKILSSYIEEMGLKPPPNEALTMVDRFDEDGWVIKRKAALHKALNDGSPKSYFKLFYILSASQIRTRFREQEQMEASRTAFVRSIVDDALEQAMIYCIRNDNYQIAYAYRRSGVVDGEQVGVANMFSGSRTSADFSKAHDKRSLSSRIFGFSGKDHSPGSSTATASVSAATLVSEQTGSARYNNVAGNRSSAKLDGGRSLSPKPSSLMGRLMGTK